MLTKVPTILLINNTGTIPGLTDPFMLHAHCHSNKFGSLYVESIQDDRGTTSGAEVDSGESYYFGEGTRNVLLSSRFFLIVRSFVFPLMRKIVWLLGRRSVPLHRSDPRRLDDHNH